MKNIVFLFALTLFANQGNLSAQGGMRLQNNVKLVCDEAVNIVIEDGRLYNSGSVFDPAESTVKFVGTASTNNSVIEGKAFTFYNLEINKSQNNLKLLINSTIKNQLIFNQGNLDLNNRYITLSNGSGSAALLFNESENSHTIGSISSARVQKTATLTNPVKLYLGEMGIRLSASGSFGKSSVDRRHQAQTLPSGTSIERYWRITTTNTPSNQGGNLKLHYLESELNGLNESTLSVWYSSNSGQSWTDVGFQQRSTNQNYVEVGGLNDLEGWWTLGTQTSLIGPMDDRTPSAAATIAEANWNISPNPASDFAYAMFQSEKEQSVIIQLYSLEGKLVLSSPYSMQIGENKIRLDLSALSPGVYFARISGQHFKAISLVKGF